MGNVVEFDRCELEARLGLARPDGLRFIVKRLTEHNLIEVTRDEPPALGVRLTIDGWVKAEELRRSSKDSRLIFMAMQFKNDVLRELVDEHFKPAAEAAGFTMRRVDEEPRAGLIDDLIRVDIRNSAMVVADLSDGNHGAIWESGFAEGLGRPVIYTCEAGAFHEKTKRHFDVEHAQTIKWETGKFEQAADEVKAAIRATLPHLAKMED